MYLHTYLYVYAPQETARSRHGGYTRRSPAGGEAALGNIHNSTVYLYHGGGF